MKVRFIEIDEVLRLHVDQIERYGGSSGPRDLGLLESAVATPQASLGRVQLHSTLPEMAAAYLFHVVKGHAFVDGNKRVAVATMLMFIYLNDHDLDCTEDEVVDLTIGIAASRRTKADAAVFLAERLGR